MNSSFYYAQKMHAQNLGNAGSDWQSQSNLQSYGNMKSQADLKSKEGLSVHYADDLNFKSPDRDMMKVRQTSPRAKYGMKKEEKNTMSRGLLHVARNKR